MGQSHTPREAAAAKAVVRLSHRLRLDRAYPNPLPLPTRRRIAFQIAPHVVARAISNEGNALTYMRQELDVARYLLKNGAPVVGPSAELPECPHIEGGFVFTFWEFVKDLNAAEDNAEHVALAADALRRVHEGLNGFRSEWSLPKFSVPINNCHDLLMQAALTGLHERDRSFLVSTFDHLRASADSLSMDMRPIHGDAHLGNVFITADGARWNDLEDVCCGPREWDVSWFYKKNDLAVFEPLNRELVSTLHYMRKLCTVVWSYQSNDLERHKAAECILAYLKQSRLF
ncbi:phosphotransferase [Bradyrhizobium genosp. P]|uniref:phosphotransferase n=1 Tax=Bradyrhizobium genosp. P TaxID=83641 RepID=UPI003CF42455